MSGISGGVSGLLGSIMGNDAGKDEMAKSLGLSREALAELRRLYVPTVEEQEVDSRLFTPEFAGNLSAEQLSESEMAGISADPRYSQARLKAAEQLSGLAQTGLGVEDQAAFSQLRRQAADATQAQIATILANPANQGQGTSVTAQLDAAQNQANRLQSGVEAQAATAAANRRNAIMQLNQVTSEADNNIYNRKANVATAKDSINKFNSQNRQDVNQYNFGNRQSINNQIGQNAEKAGYYNSGLIQSKFQNDLSKATGVAGQTNNLANMQNQQGHAAAQGQADFNKTLINGGASIGAAYAKKGV